MSAYSRVLGTNSLIFLIKIFIGKKTKKADEIYAASLMPSTRVKTSVAEKAKLAGYDASASM